MHKWVDNKQIYINGLTIYKYTLMG